MLPDGSLWSIKYAGTSSLNAPTGAWCSLTTIEFNELDLYIVSMHLQVRGAP